MQAFLDVTYALDDVVDLGMKLVRPLRKVGAKRANLHIELVAEADII